MPWSEVEGILSLFDALDPFGDGRPFWKIEKGPEASPLHILSLGIKRYVKAVLGPEGWEVVGGTEHALGGGVVDPPAMRGRGTDRRHLWTIPVAQYALDRAEAEHRGLVLPEFHDPWDTP